jgi:tRNA(fMet)-specific endonuclease VapC
VNAPRYLLGNNIVSDLVRHPQGLVARRVAAVGEVALCTSIVVAAELRFGAAKRNLPRLSTQVEVILASMDVLPFDSPADRVYAELRLELEKADQPIGPNDLLIAAHAMAIDCVLVSANTNEFSRVSGLRVDNWLATLSEKT